MKKIIPAVFSFSFISSVSFSQFSKGSLLLGGDLSFNTQKSTSGASEYKSNGISFSPTVAVATKQNIYWGGSLNAGFSKSTSRSPVSTQKNNNYGAGIFCRKYMPVAGKLYAFIQGGILAGFGKYKNESSPDTYTETKNFNTGFTITPGISVAVSKKMFLESGFSNIAAVNYQHSRTSSYNFGNTTTGKSSGFSFSSSLGDFSNTLYFGFRFILPSKN